MAYGGLNKQMDAVAEIGRNSVSTRFSLSMEMSRLTRDGTAEPVSRDQILRRERGQGKTHFPCSAEHEQDWQPCSVDPSLPICDNHTCILVFPVQLTTSRIGKLTRLILLLLYVMTIHTYIHTYIHTSPGGKIER